MTRRDWGGAASRRLSNLLAQTQGRAVTKIYGAMVAEQPLLPPELVCRHLFDTAAWLNRRTQRFGEGRFDFLTGRPTRAVSGMPEIAPSYRCRLLVGTGRLMAGDRRAIIGAVSRHLHLRSGFHVRRVARRRVADNAAYLETLFAQFFGPYPDHPALVYPMPIYTSSRYAAATAGVRIADVDVAANRDERSDHAVYGGGSGRWHTYRFGTPDATRDLTTDLQLAAFARPADRGRERQSLSSWRRTRVGRDARTNAYVGGWVYQEEIGYSTRSAEDLLLRREAYLPSYGEKIYRDGLGRTRYIDLGNLHLVRLLPLGSELAASADAITLAFDRDTGEILDSCPINSPFGQFYTRGLELRELLGEHVRRYHC